MKKLIIIIICLVTFTIVKSQRLHVVPYYNWSSKTSFMISPSPVITGYGILSDSLSKSFDGVTFYEYNGEYYPINSWADYYYWYVNKYWYQFNEPGLYEFYYRAKDDYGMAQYICGANYYGRMYPTRIAVSFPGRGVYVNNLSPYRIRRCIKKNSWDNKYYIAKREHRPKTDPNLTNRRVNSKKYIARNSSNVNNKRINHSKYDRTQLYRNSSSRHNNSSLRTSSAGVSRNKRIVNRNNSFGANHKTNSVSRSSSNSNTNTRSTSNSGRTTNSRQTNSSSSTVKSR